MTCNLLPPVLFELRRSVEDWRVYVDDFQFDTAGGTIDYLSRFQIVVQGHVGPALNAFYHRTLLYRSIGLKSIVFNYEKITQTVVYVRQKADTAIRSSVIK